MAEIPFDTTTPPAWANAINGWKWIPSAYQGGRPVGWEKRGPCPRCTHEMNVLLGITEGIEPIPASAYCNCAHQHKAGSVGCGQAAPIGGPPER